jgi:hypothetical protein
MNKFLIPAGVAVLILGLFILSPYSKNIFSKPGLDVQSFQKLSLSEQVEYLDSVSGKIGIIEIRDFIKKAYPNEPNSEHELTHKLGELAVKKEGIDGFGLCDSLLQFGCFHGAALAAVRINGNSPNLIRELLEACKKNSKAPGSCFHGLGHAIIMIKQYDLMASYRECENILTGNDSYWCQDGASMENMSRSMAPAGLGKYGSEDDIYYPCNSIPKKYENVCVRNHVGYLYRMWGLDLVRAITFCKSSIFAEDTIKECIHILGSIIASDYVDNSENLIKKCQLAGTYQNSCIDGAVTSHSMARLFDHAGKLCDTLKAPDYDACHRKIIDFKNSVN